VLCSVRTKEKKIALTFDDGPNPKYTPLLLTKLAEHCVSATFFLIGRNLKRHPEIGRRIVQEGHEVGNHTYNHRTLPFLFKASIRNELASTHQLIADLLNVQSKRTYMELLGRHGVAVMDYPRPASCRTTLAVPESPTVSNSSCLIALDAAGSLGILERLYRTIALSIERSAARLILDDKKPRRVARQLNLPVTGTLAVLLNAKERGIIPKVRDTLDVLISANFRISFWAHRSG